MTQFDCEEAICDNPGTSFFFPGLLVTVDGSHPSTCLTTYLLWEQILSKSLASSHLGIFCTDYPSPLGCALGAWVDLQTNIHLHLLQRLGSVSVTNFSPGAQKGETAPCPCASRAPGGAGRIPKAHLETPPPRDHRVTLRQDLVHSQGKTTWV